MENLIVLDDGMALFVSFEINLCVWALTLKTADFDSISVPFVDKNCILC